jgi:hypothetical protein
MMMGGPPALNARRTLSLIGILWLAGVSVASGQAPADSGGPAWTAQAYLGLTADADLHPIAIASYAKGALYLEGRYNYEEAHTGSLFAGRAFTADGKVSLWITPMIGAVVGDLNGVAPAFEVEVGLGRVTFSDETELVIAFGDKESSFLYAWGQLTAELTPWFQPGVVYQRTRLYQASLDVAWGPMVMAQFGRLNVSVYGFDLAQDDRYGLLGLALDF